MNSNQPAAAQNDTQRCEYPRTRLIIAPYADDEVLGCVGLLAKDGNECVVAVCSVPSPIRRGEAAKARDVLGYREMHCHVAAYSLELSPTGLKFNALEHISGSPASAKALAPDAYHAGTSSRPSPSNGQALVSQASAPGSMHRLDAIEQYATVRIVR